MAYYDPERAAVNLLRQSISTDTNETPVKTGIQRFENVLGSLEASIDGLLAYVEKVKVRRKPRGSHFVIVSSYRVERYQLTVK